jgi:GNAT superfamily N-acetyltransferase
VIRCPVQVRDAEPDDVEELRGVLASGDDRGGDVEQVAAGCTAVASIAADPDQRLLVAMLGGRIVGVAHLVRGPISPLQGDSAVQVLNLNVLEEFRRHGVGHALMEGAVAWAEEKDTTHIVAATPVGSRDANRFMARLGLGQVAIVRATTVSALRSKLGGDGTVGRSAGRRSHHLVGQVLAQRRSLRRSQAKTS